MASLDLKFEYAARVQLAFLSLTWIAGIYVNGFVPMVPGEGARSVLLNPAVGAHVILASLSAATALFMLGLAWAGNSLRATAFALLASVSIVVAGASGLGFVLGGGGSGDSLVMGVAFATSIFLTHLSAARGGAAGAAGPRADGAARLVCGLALLLFYLVLVSGIYVNLFVVGPVYSLPLGKELAAFKQAESSPAFVAHGAFGGALLLASAALAVRLIPRGGRAVSLAAVLAAVLVACSAYVGSLDLTSPPVPSSGSALVPMLSAAGQAGALFITMLLSLELGGHRLR